VNVVMVAAGLGALWIGSEALPTRVTGRHFSSRMMVACALRDFLLPPLWVVASLHQGHVWRGDEVNVKQVVAEEQE
jgi:hypothetical protein